MLAAYLFGLIKIIHDLILKSEIEIFWKMPGALGGTSAGGISHQPSSSGGGGPTISFLSAAQLQSTMRPPGAISASGAAGDDLYDVEREMRNFWPRQKEKLEQMSVVRLN